MTREQVYIQQRLAQAEIVEWRHRGAMVAVELAALLATRGLMPIAAPPMPTQPSSFDGEIVGPYRILTTWIPDWSPNADAGHHVVRVDTFAERREDAAQTGVYSVSTP